MPGNRGILLAGVLCCATAATPALADWQAELRQQIRTDHECEVAFLTQIVERDVEGSRTVMAKVHCEDKRTFDAMRQDDYELFQFRLCGQEDVSAC